ncbi:hypothetical protein [Deferribacter abyssi]|uniref:hypothetical protein n=1 Tax=Deferribacter abyssi TaxID=213806 RepID=UPI003C1B6271
MKEIEKFSIGMEILRIGNKAVKEAQKESLKKGIPNVYSLNGVIFYQLPDGTITINQPDEYKKIDKLLKNR